MATIESIDGRPIWEHHRDDGRRAMCRGCGAVVSPFQTIVADYQPLDLNCEWGWQCYECGFTDEPSGWIFFFIPQANYEYRTFPPATAVPAATPKQRDLFD